jgi:chaperonin GroES
MIKPLGNLLLVKQIEEGEKKTSSGLVLAASYASQGPKYGTVVAVGEGEQNYLGDVIPVTGITVGDTVIYPDHSGTEIDDGEEKYLLISSKNILAVKG